jgi:RNA polymerase sigma factor (sigma-70 family)
MHEPVPEHLRRLTPQVLGALVRRYGNFDLAEDATQEALIAASTQWARDGLPRDPRAWLIAVAARKLTDLLRSEQARRRREETVAGWALAEPVGPEPGRAGDVGADDTLVLLFMCCHPSLPIASQIALTLKAVGGLSTAEIARSLLTSEQTITRRITRAKQTIRASGVPFALTDDESGRLSAVLHVLYLIFTEGYASTAGTELLRVDLCDEAIRLTRMLRRIVPDDSETAGLLALMLLIHARHPARTGADGALIPMADQDRSLWDQGAIAEGVDLITRTLPFGPTGPYQLQAAIAAVHDEASTAEDTDWQQIAALYGLLTHVDDSPVIALNQAVAVSMVDGPHAALALLDTLQNDPRLAQNHRYHAVRAHLLGQSGNDTAALAAYAAAAELASNMQQRRYLEQQIALLRARQ